MDTQARTFAFYFSDTSSGCKDCEEAIKKAVKEHKESISNVNDNTIFFSDGSKVKWYGSGFKIHKK